MAIAILVLLKINGQTSTTYTGFALTNLEFSSEIKYIRKQLLQFPSFRTIFAKIHSQHRPQNLATFDL